MIVFKVDTEYHILYIYTKLYIIYIIHMPLCVYDKMYSLEIKKRKTQLFGVLSSIIRYT